MSIGHFLGGIAALIWDSASGRYLLLRRSAQRDFEAGAWECVTGRVEQGESYEQALYREVREETGVEVRIEFLLATTHFYRGAAIPENELLGAIYSCTLETPGEAMHGDEHSESRWLTLAEIDQLLPEDYWLRRAIHRAEKMRKSIPAELRSEFRRDGFEL
ncbi:MAG: hypothetical protein B6D39_02060 [Anaerolineae bacterium UTCFX2]|jgi:8-oxo-dGTP diphosphatase|nr:NUDIX domain-containing protein [Anaerolineales bacterium]OQY94150.1 MAG: hypothetical protein B6D39_02060 [Anaerolineae bacterium UTCFX2]